MASHDTGGFKDFLRFLPYLAERIRFLPLIFQMGGEKPPTRKDEWILATFFVTHLQFPLKPPSPTNRCFPAEMPRRKRLTFSPTEDIISNLRCLQRVLISIRNPCLEIFLSRQAMVEGKRASGDDTMVFRLGVKRLKFLEPWMASLTFVRGFRGRIVKSREDGKFEVWI